MLPDDPVSVLRVTALLAFLASFVGLVAWLLRPSVRRACEEDAALIPFREDGGGGGRAAAREDRP